MVEQKNGIRQLVSAVLLSLISTLSTPADTWQLQQQGWEPVGSSNGQMAVLEAKRLANTGNAKEAARAWGKIKKDYPQINGPDLDIFIEGELLFAKNNFPKAIKSYDKLLDKYHQSSLYEAALNREFEMATAYLAGRKKTFLGIFRIKGYAEGEKIMERITDRGGDSPLAAKAAVAVAQSLEKRKKFDEAYLKWSQVGFQWPSGQTGKDALLAMARCKYAAYKGSKYDVSSLVSAKSYYENYRIRYPQDAQKIGVDGTVKQINEQLADKQLEIGRYYQRTGNRQSANLYYQMVINNWPQTQAEKAAQKLIKP